jgi:hypothetical protein
LLRLLVPHCRIVLIWIKTPRKRGAPHRFAFRNPNRPTGGPGRDDRRTGRRRRCFRRSLPRRYAACHRHNPAAEVGGNGDEDQAAASGRRSVPHPHDGLDFEAPQSGALGPPG